MKYANTITTMLLVIGLAAPTGSWAQGKGKERRDDRKAEHVRPAAQKQDRAQRRGRPDDKPGRQQATRAQRQGPARARSEPMSGRERARGQQGRSVRTAVFERDVAARQLRPSVRRLVRSNRAPQRVVAGALARAYARGIDDDAFVIRRLDDGVRINNRAGEVLIDIDDARARNLGYWNVRPMRYVVRSDAPRFCRSGAGHPRWGRQWCIDKGFGLGSYRDLRWGRSTSIGDIIFGRRVVDRETLLRDALIATVGNVVLDRLGLHALTLGYTEPLSGSWVVEPAGPQVLLINSGSYPVAELIDLDRDRHADIMLVALRPW